MEGIGPKHDRLVGGWPAPWGTTRKRLHELLVDAYVRGVPHAEGLFQLVQGDAPAEEPDGEGVTQDHGRDAPHADRVAPLPDGVLKRLGGGHRPGCSANDELGRLIGAHPQVTPEGFDRLGGEAPGAGGEVRARAAELDLAGREVYVLLEKAPDLPHRHARVEHEPDNRGVTGRVR